MTVFFTIDLLLMVSHACTQNFRTIAPFLLVEKQSPYKKEQGLRQDSEAATINELTDQSKRISC